jgi:PAS domain-containing protein
MAQTLAGLQQLLDQLSQESRASEKKNRFQGRLLDAVGQAVIATDLGGNIISWNHFAET